MRGSWRKDHEVGSWLSGTDANGELYFNINLIVAILANKRLRDFLPDVFFRRLSPRLKRDQKFSIEFVWIERGSPFRTYSNDMWLTVS